MSSAFLDISIVFIFLLVNGVFAMTEIAIVSSRKGLLQSMAEKGSKGAAKALSLAENPNQFLSTVQIGITLASIMAGALGADTLAVRLQPIVEVIPLIGTYAEKISLGIAFVLLTYFSLVIGELVPKRLAMKFPESIATAMAMPMAALAAISSPLVKLLSWSTGRLLKLFGVRETEDGGMSREELTVLVRQGMVTGSINATESRMM